MAMEITIKIIITYNFKRMNKGKIKNDVIYTRGKS